MSDRGEEIVRRMQKDWIDVPTLLRETGWKPHTLRAAISTSARKLNLKLERRRIEGVTSYRVAE